MNTVFSLLIILVVVICLGVVLLLGFFALVWASPDFRASVFARVTAIRLLFEAKKQSASEPLPTNLEYPTYGLTKDSLKLIKVSEFVEVLTIDDLSILTIDGEPCEQQLKDSWDALNAEFSERIKNSKTITQIKLVAEINDLIMHINHVNGLIGFIEIGRFEEAVKELHRLGMTYKFERDTYQEDLRRCRNRVKKWESQREAKEREMAELTEGNETQSKPTKDDFLSIISTLRKERNYQKPTDQIYEEWSMETYVIELNKWTEEVERHNREVEKQRAAKEQQ